MAKGATHHQALILGAAMVAIVTCRTATGTVIATQIPTLTVTERTTAVTMAAIVLAALVMTLAARPVGPSGKVAVITEWHSLAAMSSFIAIGRAESAFLRYDFPLRPGLLRPGRNTLTFAFRSALTAARDLSAAYPYKVPHTHYYNVWSEPSHRWALASGISWQACSVHGGPQGPLYIGAPVLQSKTG